VHGVSARNGRQTPLDRLRLDDRGIGLRLVGDAIDDLVELFDRTYEQSRNEAVVPRHLVAFAELGDALDQLLHNMNLAGQGPDANDGLQLVAKRLRVDVDCEGTDDAAFLEAPQPLRRARRGQPFSANGSMLGGYIMSGIERWPHLCGQSNPIS
jgi:hypothetical protein